MIMAALGRIAQRHFLQNFEPPTIECFVASCVLNTGAANRSC